MSLHDELLATARALVGGPHPSDADLRRGISTAYYALFHRLIDAAVHHFLPTHNPDQHAGFARVFEHAKMRDVCRVVAQSAKQPNPNPSPPVGRILGYPIPAELKQVADAFGNLQKLRFDADYNRVPPISTITLAAAEDAIGKVESAFADWNLLETNHRGVARAFLVLLLTGEPKGR